MPAIEGSAAIVDNARRGLTAARIRSIQFMNEFGPRHWSMEYRVAREVGECMRVKRADPPPSGP
jgi:hypothetical protein